MSWGPNSDVATGRIESDRFVIKETLGTGAMGVVYRAHDNVRRMDVALKTLRSADGAMLYRFKREFRSLAGIVHPNLVTLFELQSAGAECFFTMALVDGLSFLEHVRPYEEAELAAGAAADVTRSVAPTQSMADGALSARAQASQLTTGRRERARRRQVIIDATLDMARLRSALPQLARGVHALHCEGKLHRDLKPSNVLVERSGRVVVCDFGLVADVEPDADRTQDVRLAGTPAYMSPEQAALAPLAEASDWYSFGVMLYETLSGRLVFDGAAVDLLRDKQTCDPIPVRELVPDAPADLADLCTALLHRDPNRRPSGSQILDALGCGATAVAEVHNLPDIPFIGRESQLAALRDALTDARGGRAVTVFVHGSSGMGKSSVVRRFLDEAQDTAGALLLEGRCHLRESVPYKALDALVDGLSSFLLQLPAPEAQALIPRDIESLARLFPVLLRVRAVAEPDRAASAPADPHELRHRAFAALGFMLAEIAARRPTVLFIDDLQWGDLDSAAFLRDLIYAAEAPPVLFVATYREEEAATSPLLGTLLAHANHGAGEADVRSIAIEELGGEEGNRLAMHILGHERAGASERAAAVAQEAGGNPFFITELAAAAARAAAGGSTAGGTLAELIGGRVARLPDDARDLLTIAAVAGRPIPLVVASRAANVQDEARALAALQAERLALTREAGPVEEIEPYHDQIRANVTRALSERDARRANRRLARAIETSNRADPIALVEHWLGADDREKAGFYAVAAAAQAERALAFDRAAHHYRQVLELKELDDDDERRELQRLLGDALAHAGSLGEAAAVYLEAAEGAPRLDRIDLRRCALEQMLRSGKLDSGLMLAREVLQEVGVRLPRSRLASILSILYRRLRLSWRGYDFEARPLEEIDPEILLRLDTYWAMSSGLSFVNMAYAAAVRMRFTLEALDAGDLPRAVYALAVETGFASRAGGRTSEQLAEVSKRANALAKGCADPGPLGALYVMQGIACGLCGEFRKSYDALVETERFLLERLAGGRWEIDMCQLYQVSNLVYLGRMKELVSRVPGLINDALERGDEFLSSGLRSWRGNVVWLALDTPDEARRQVEEAWNVRRPDGSFQLNHYFRLLARCQIDLYQGRAVEAHQRVEKTWRPLKKSMLLRAQSTLVEGLFLRGRCALAAAAVSEKRRRRRLGIALRSARLIEGEATAWGNPLALLLRGCAAAVAGDSDGAGALFRDAAVDFAAADMGLFAAVARYGVGALRGGVAGEAMVREAVEWMRAEEIRVPERMVAMCAPGIPRAGADRSAAG